MPKDTPYGQIKKITPLDAFLDAAEIHRISTKSVEKCLNTILTSQSDSSINQMRRYCIEKAILMLATNSALKDFTYTYALILYRYNWRPKISFSLDDNRFNTLGWADLETKDVTINDLNRLSQSEIMGTLSHEIAHLVFEYVYENQANPYQSIEHERINFQQIIKKVMINFHQLYLSDTLLPSNVLDMAENLIKTQPRPPLELKSIDKYVLHAICNVFKYKKNFIDREFAVLLPQIQAMLSYTTLPGHLLEALQPLIDDFRDRIVPDIHKKIESTSPWINEDYMVKAHQRFLIQDSIIAHNHTLVRYNDYYYQDIQNALILQENLHTKLVKQKTIINNTFEFLVLCSIIIIFVKYIMSKSLSKASCHENPMYFKGSKNIDRTHKEHNKSMTSLNILAGERNVMETDLSHTRNMTRQLAVIRGKGLFTMADIAELDYAVVKIIGTDECIQPMRERLFTIADIKYMSRDALQELIQKPCIDALREGRKTIRELSIMSENELNEINIDPNVRRTL